MYKLVNKVTTLPTTKDNPVKVVTYKDLIKAVLNTVTKELVVDEMRIRIKILDKVSDLEDNAEFELTTEEMTTLRNILTNFPWALVHADIVAFCDYINDLPE